MATLYQRNGQYWINYAINGKRIRKSVGKDKLEAQIVLNELRLKLSNGDIKPKRPEIPLTYFFDKYLENCQSRLTAGTNERYRSIVDRFRKFFTICFPIQFISQITKGSLQEYVLYRQDAKRKPRNKTVNVELSVIRAALTWAVDREWIERNPSSRIKMLKTNDSKRGKALTQEEVDALLCGCDVIKHGKWFKDLLLVFLNTGMRRGELTNLTWDDIDFEQNIIKIQEKSFWSPKTYERDIPINQKTKEILNRIIESRINKWVFTRNGGKIEANKLRKKLITLSKSIGLPHITRIHDLRHTFASNLLMAGVDIPTVQALMGHKSWNTTLIYSHQTKEHTHKAIEKLG